MGPVGPVHEKAKHRLSHEGGGFAGLGALGFGFEFAVPGRQMGGIKRYAVGDWLPTDQVVGALVARLRSSLRTNLTAVGFSTGKDCGVLDLLGEIGVGVSPGRAVGERPGGVRFLELLGSLRFPEKGC